MATVTNTYARAFVDVVIDRKLDAAKTLAEAQSIAALVAASKEFKRSMGSAIHPARSKEKTAGCDRS